jgi:hypothetical protein
MTADLQRVEYLVSHMLDSMEKDCVAIDASADDVVSAALTVCLRTIKATKEMNCDMEPIKHVVSTMLLECMSDIAAGADAQ